MEKIIFWALAAYGMSTIIIYGSIFEGFRNFIHRWGNNKLAPLQGLGNFLSGLIKCMLCTSTWVGFFLSLAYFSPNVEIIGLNKILAVFFDGMLGAGFVWAINAIIEWFEENRPSNK
jgi:hypothetical protein